MSKKLAKKKTAPKKGAKDTAKKKGFDETPVSTKKLPALNPKSLDPDTVIQKLHEFIEANGNLKVNEIYLDKTMDQALSEHNFVSKLQQAIGGWLPDVHAEFLSLVYDKKISDEASLERLSEETQKVIFTVFSATFKGERFVVEDSTLLELWPEKPREDHVNPKSTGGKKRRKKDDPETEEEEADMATTKKTSKKKAAGKKKTVAKTKAVSKKTAAKGKKKPSARSKGGSGQLGPLGKMNWSAVDPKKKVVQGEAPRRMAGEFGDAYNMLSSKPMLIETFIKKVADLTGSGGKAKQIVWRILNRFHGKIVK